MEKKTSFRIGLVNVQERSLEMLVRRVIEAIQGMGFTLVVDPHQITKADVLLSFAPPGSVLQKQIIEEGLVCIFPRGTPLFQDFDPQAEKGNAFLFDPDNFWSLVRAIVRASENFKFSYDWKNLKQSVKKIKA